LDVSKNGTHFGPELIGDRQAWALWDRFQKKEQDRARNQTS